MAHLNQSDDLKDFLTTTKRKKINPNKKNKKKEEEKELARLMVDELFEIKKLKVGQHIWKDGKRLEKLLEDICKTVNALTKCAAQQTRLTATELVARPTYIEEFQNIRDNVNRAILPKEDVAALGISIQKQVSASGDQEDEQFDEDYDNISHLSKFSIRRHRNHETAVAAAELEK